MENHTFSKTQISESYRQFKIHIKSVMNSDTDTYDTFFKGFMNFCETDEVMRSITLKIKEIDVPFDDWWCEKRKWPNGRRKFDIPTDPLKRVAFLYQLCLKIFQNEPGFDYLSVGLEYFGSIHVNDNIDSFNQHVIRQLVEYFEHNFTIMKTTSIDDMPQKQELPPQIIHYHGPVIQQGAKSIAISESSFEGVNTVGQKAKVQNPVNVKTTAHKIEKRDFGPLGDISPYLMSRYGKTKITIGGLISAFFGFLPFISGLKSLIPSTSGNFHVIIIDIFPTFSQSIGFVLCVLGFILIICGLLLLQVPSYYAFMICDECKREYAYDEIGTSTFEEIETKRGYNEVTTRHYKCRFCGYTKEDVSVKKFDKKGNRIN
jgi:hypothetical protein